MIDNATMQRSTSQCNAAADNDDGDYVRQLQREAQLEHQPHLQGARIPGS